MNYESYNFTSKELEDLKPKVGVLPIGSFEQHGYHLPMTTDTLIAEEISKSICTQINALLLPPITISCSQEHKGFYGNAFISSETLSRIICDVLKSLAYSDIHHLIIVNGHGGNYILRNISQELNLKNKNILLFPTSKHWKKALLFAKIETALHEDMHAGEIETSIFLHLNPNLVRQDKLIDELATDRSFLHLIGMEGYTKTGVIGIPTLATKRKGKLLLESLKNSAVEDINIYLPEI